MDDDREKRKLGDQVTSPHMTKRPRTAPPPQHGKLYLTTEYHKEFVDLLLHRLHFTYAFNYNNNVAASEAIYIQDEDVQSKAMEDVDKYLNTVLEKSTESDQEAVTDDEVKRNNSPSPEDEADVIKLLQRDFGSVRA
jgi:hypothetical protein